MSELLDYMLPKQTSIAKHMIWLAALFPIPRTVSSISPYPVTQDSYFFLNTLFSACLGAVVRLAKDTQIQQTKQTAERICPMGSNPSCPQLDEQRAHRPIEPGRDYTTDHSGFLTCPVHALVDLVTPQISKHVYVYVCLVVGLGVGTTIGHWTQGWVWSDNPPQKTRLQGPCMSACACVCV